MNQQRNSEPIRRDLLKGAAAAGLAFTAGVGDVSQAAGASLAGENPIRKENAKPGTRDWMLTKTEVIMTDDLGFSDLGCNGTSQHP